MRDILTAYNTTNIFIYPKKKITQTPLGLKPDYNNGERVLIIISQQFNKVSYEIIFNILNFRVIHIKPGTYFNNGFKREFSINYCSVYIIPELNKKLRKEFECILKNVV